MSGACLFSVSCDSDGMICRVAHRFHMRLVAAVVACLDGGKSLHVEKTRRVLGVLLIDFILITHLSG